MLNNDTGLPLGRPVFYTVDSHAHLSAPEFDADREEVFKRAEAAGVSAILCPVDLTSPHGLPAAERLLSGHANLVLAAGVHPEQTDIFSEAHLNRIKYLAQAGIIRAVGEIGLDYFYEPARPEKQKAVLLAQLEAARETGLPVILHSRLSGTDIVDAVKGAGFMNGGILHCFTENIDIARAMLDLGFYISFSGILTYRKADNVREAARFVPADRLLAETDSPYLVPAGLRKKHDRNEPAFIFETLAKLAETRKAPLESTAEAVTANFRRLFPV